MKQINFYEQNLDLRRRQLLFKVIPGFEKLDSPKNKKQVIKDSQYISQFDLDDTSEAGTVIENELDLYNEPD